MLQVQDLQRVQSRFPEVADQLQSLTENLTAQEKSAKFFDTVELVSLAQTPELYRAELNQRIEASESNPEQQRALQAQLQAYDAAEQAQEGGGAAYARIIGGMSALQLADNEQQREVLSQRLFPEPEAPLSTIGKLSADLEAGLITQKQFDAEVASRQRRDQQMGSTPSHALTAQRKSSMVHLAKLILVRPVAFVRDTNKCKCCFLMAQ